MSKVILAVRVNPEGSEVDLDELLARIRESLPPHYELLKSERFYIAFGLYGLRLYIAMPEDYEGGTYELENVLGGVKGVSSIDVEYVTRMPI